MAVTSRVARDMDRHSSEGGGESSSPMASPELITHERKILDREDDPLPFMGRSWVTPAVNRSSHHAKRPPLRKKKPAAIAEQRPSQETCTPPVLARGLQLYKSLYIVGEPKEELKKEQIQVGIYFEHGDSLSMWTDSLKYAISEINEATPGLKLFLELREPQSPQSPTETKKMIRICGHENPEECGTTGNIKYWLAEDEPLIKLGTAYGGDKNRATVHELLHALGFEHQHQRADATDYIEFLHPNEPVEGKVLRNLQSKKKYQPIVPFDPYSIMMYEEGYGFVRKEGVKVWKDRPREGLNLCMSELDKVALNYVYPPRIIEGHYTPVQSENGMHYCGRDLAKRNRPLPLIVGVCGPVEKGGPNCPACRVLSRPIEMKDEKWQGWSGYVYCGKPDCQENYGKPCRDCEQIVSVPNPPQKCNSLQGSNAFLH